MLIIDLIGVVFAVDAIITAWFYGSIFESWRKWTAKLPEPLGELFSCTLCFPYHVSFWAVVLLVLPAQFLSEPWSWIPRTILYSFAVTDLVHWLQGERPIPFEDKEDEPNG